MGFRGAGDGPSAGPSGGAPRVGYGWHKMMCAWLLPRSRCFHRVRVFRFVVVGGLGMLMNTVALYVSFRLISLPLLVASVLAVETAIVHNYLWNDRWTFGGRRLSWQRFAKFNISALGGLVVNSLALWFLARLGVYYLTANLFGALIAFLVNYALSVRWVWREGV